MPLSQVKAGVGPGAHVQRKLVSFQKKRNSSHSQGGGEVQQHPQTNKLKGVGISMDPSDWQLISC